MSVSINNHNHRLLSAVYLSCVQYSLIHKDEPITGISGASNVGGQHHLPKRMDHSLGNVIVIAIGSSTQRDHLPVIIRR